jgi:hypothetical protein
MIALSALVAPGTGPRRSPRSGHEAGGMVAACDEPVGFAGPVRLFVLRYGFEPSAVEADPPLVETARRLSYPMRLDVLANDSFGSIASILTPCRR